MHAWGRAETLLIDSNKMLWWCKNKVQCGINTSFRIQFYFLKCLSSFRAFTLINIFVCIHINILWKPVSATELKKSQFWLSSQFWLLSQNWQNDRNLQLRVTSELSSQNCEFISCNCLFACLYYIVYSRIVRCKLTIVRIAFSPLRSKVQMSGLCNVQRELTSTKYS